MELVNIPIKQPYHIDMYTVYVEILVSQMLSKNAIGKKVMILTTVQKDIFSA